MPNRAARAAAARRMAGGEPASRATATAIEAGAALRAEVQSRARRREMAKSRASSSAGWAPLAAEPPESIAPISRSNSG